MRIMSKIYKKITACVLAVAMVASLPEVSQAKINNSIKVKEETADTVTLGNSFITLSVSKKNGGYTLKTSEGDVLTKTDNNKRLLYAPDGDATSFATVRIDGTDYIYGNVNEGRFISRPHIEDGNTVVSTYAIADKNVNVTQTIRLLMDSGDDKLGAIQISYSLSNTASPEAESSVPVKAGLRMVLDTCLGAQDWAVYEMAKNGVNGTYNQYTNAVRFDKSDIASEFRALDNNYAPRVAAYGYPDEKLDKPDSMVFGHWFDMASNMWKFDVDENMKLTDNSNPYKTADSAVALYWNENNIAPGAVSEYSFFYGISANNNVTENDTMQMTVKADKDMFVLKDISKGESSAYEDNILNIQTKISNTMPASVFRANVAVQLMVDEEFLQIDYNDVTDDNGDKLAVEQNAGKNLIHITNLEAGQTKFINWKIHVKHLPQTTRYLKYALKVYEYKSSDNANDYAFLDRMALCSAKGNILAPGYTGRKPKVSILSGAPEYLYYTGNRNFIIKGEGYEILKDKTEWEMLLHNTATGDTSIIDSSRITFNSDYTGMIVNFADEMPVGQYQLIIKPGESLTKSEVGLPERITSDNMNIVFSDDKNLVNPPVGGVAIKKVGKDAGTRYKIEMFNDASELEELDDDYLLTFTGNLYRSNVNGSYTVPIIGDASAEDIIINRIVSYSGYEFSIDYTYDKNGRESGVQVRMDGDTGILGGSHNLWEGESVIVLKNGREYSLDRDDTTEGEANAIKIEQKGFVGALQKISGFVFKIDYGTFNRIEEDDKSYNTISFGGSLSLGFMSVDKYDGVDTGYAASISVDDVRYGEKKDGSKGHIGIIANADVPVPQFINPLPADLSGGLAIDTINYPYLVNVNGSMGLATFSADFELEIIGSKKHGVPVPNIIRLKVGGINPGAPIIPPVVFIHGGEGSIKGLYSLFYPGEDEHNVPDTDITIAGQFSIVDVMKGWLGLSVGTRHASIYGKGLSICELPILKSVSGDFTWYPSVSMGFKANLEMLGVINGMLSCKLIITGKKAPNICLFGSCDVTLPGVLLGQDLTIVGVEVGGDKEKIYGSTTIMGVKMGFTITFDATGSKVSVGELVVPTQGTVEGDDNSNKTTGINNAELVGTTDNDVNVKARVAEKNDGTSGTNGVYFGSGNNLPNVKVDEDGRLRILNPGSARNDSLIKVYYDYKEGIKNIEPADIEAAIDGVEHKFEALAENGTNIETANISLGEDDKGTFAIMTFKESEIKGATELAIYSDKATVSYAEMFSMGDIPEIETLTASFNDDGTLKVDDKTDNVPEEGIKCTKVIYLGTDDDKYAYEIFGGQESADRFQLDMSTQGITIPGYVPSGSYYVTEVIDGECNGADIHEEKTTEDKVDYTNPNAPSGNISKVTASAGGDAGISVSMEGYNPDTMDGVYAEAVVVDDEGKEVVPDASDIAEAVSGEAISTNATAYIEKDKISNGVFNFAVNPSKEGNNYKVKVSPYKLIKTEDDANMEVSSVISAADVALGTACEAEETVNVPYPESASITMEFPEGYVTETEYLSKEDESTAYTNKLYTEVPEGGLGINISSDKPVMAKVYVDDNMISDSTVYSNTLPTVVLQDVNGEPLKDGEHRIRVVGKTQAGDTSIAEESIKIDTAGPLLQVFSPQAGDSVKKGKIDISGITTDGATLDIEIDGHKVEYDKSGYSGGAFNVSVSVPEESRSLLSHELKITVEDSYHRTNEYNVTVDDEGISNITGVYLTVDDRKAEEGERVYINGKQSVNVSLWAESVTGSGDEAVTKTREIPSKMVSFESVSDNDSDDIIIDEEGNVTVKEEGTMALTARLYLTDDFCYQSNIVLDSCKEHMKDTDAVAPSFAYTDEYPVYDDTDDITNINAGEKVTLSASASFANEEDEGNVVIEWFGSNSDGGYTKIGEGNSIEVTPGVRSDLSEETMDDYSYFATATNTIRTTGVDTAVSSAGIKKFHIRHDISREDIICEGTSEQSGDTTYYSGEVTFRAADSENLIGEYTETGAIEWKDKIVKSALSGGEHSFPLVIKTKDGTESKPFVYVVNIRNNHGVELAVDGTIVEGVSEGVKAYSDAAEVKLNLTGFSKAEGVSQAVYEVENKRGKVSKNIDINEDGTGEVSINLTEQGINTVKVIAKDSDGKIIERYTYMTSIVIYKVPECDFITETSYTYTGNEVQFDEDNFICGGSNGECSLAASVAGKDEFSEAMPVNAGEYDVRLSISRDDDNYYTATSVIKTIKIAKARQIITFSKDTYEPGLGDTISVNLGGICIDDYDELEVSANNNAISIDEENIVYDKNSRTITIPVEALEVGTAVITVYVPGDDNYLEAVKSCKVTVYAAENEEHPYRLTGKMGTNGWYISDVILKPSEGYTVSETENGEYKDTYTISGEGTERNPESLFFKNESGEVRKLKIDTVNIDTSLPEGEITAGESGWRQFLNTITFGLFFNDTVVVEAEASDGVSGIDKVLYYMSDKAMTEDELAGLNDNDWTDDSVTIEPDSRAVVYARLIDSAGNMVYISTDGIIADKTQALIKVTSDDDLNSWITGHKAVINVAVSDALAGVSDSDVSYSIDGGTPYKGAESFRIENLEDGDHSIVINAHDKAGNASQKTISVKQDTVLPSIELSENSASKTLNVRCITGVSGIKAVTLINEGTSTDITDSYAAGVSIKYNGKYEVRLETNAGITVNKTITVTDIADNTEATSTPAATTQAPANETDTPKATDKAEATAAPKATDKAEATATPKATDKAEATATPKATDKAEATLAPKATDKAEATAAPKATDKAEATAAPKATDKAEATVTPKVTQAPAVTISPVVTNAPKFTSTPVPTVIETLTPSLRKTSVSLSAGQTSDIEVLNAGTTTVTYSTSNKKVAIVDNGRVIALKKGKAVITADVGGTRLTYTVTVTSSPKLARKSISVKLGKIKKVKITGLATGIKIKGMKNKYAKYTGSVSVKKAVYIKIKGLKKGKTTLKIKVNNNVTLRIKVRVK